jgi:hypothetical protein
MTILSILLKLINGYKTYASVILTIVSGLGMILSKQYSEGISQVFQGLVILFGGASVASLRHDIVSPSMELPEDPS